MSEANASAIHGPYRRKVTLACDSCRRRRVKCSGTQPCTFCSDSGRQCAFDSKNRGRRGPRPRQPVSQTPRVTQQLAPRRPSQSSTATTYIESAFEPPVEIVIETPCEASIQVSTEPVWLPPELPRVEELDKSDDETAVGSDDVNDSAEWRPMLEKIMSRESVDNTLPELDMDLMCHLIELFCTRTNTQFKSLISPAQINERILDKSISRGLLLAICASSMRFSVHPTARRPQSADLAKLLGEEARSCIHSRALNQPQMDNIRTVCILIDFEASRGCGRRAWVDIAMGRSLVQLARSSVAVKPDLVQVLDAAEQFLTVAELSHSIGHASLQPTRDRKARRPRPDTRLPLFPEGTRRLLELLEALIRISQLCSTPLTEHDPAPWSTDSDFRALQDELEEYLLWNPSIFRMGPKEPPGKTEQEDNDACMSSLLWHCCAILLNRTFLPIPERCKTANESQAPLIRCVEFPEAPPLFLKERIHRCESSADAICDITQEVISKGGFFSHTLLLGYCCTQSALVLINRLHRSSKPYDKQVVENLKLIFIVLGAVRTFYSPAQEWIDALFRAHDISTPLRHVSGNLGLAFRNYFSRFVDMEEPAFVPLDPKESKDGPDADANLAGASAAEANGDGQAIDQARPEESSSGWLQTYVGHLSGDIHDEDDMIALHEEAEIGRRTSLLDHAAGIAELAGPEEIRSGQGGDMIVSKGFTPCLQTADLMSGSANGTANGRSSLACDIDELYPELFSQIPSLGDFMGMGQEMPIFPGLGSLLDGEDIWADVLGNTMLQ
ncbi:hypothetical protein QQZ08_005466 [Neonectria magnoliae]|uniref:Zn(2)-C6 fungal-type domain-containing protein n=1 Tax=Neonectria magnoliae TaxID=2732573 RepID=A0ABR1I3C3_9HYPO